MGVIYKITNLVNGKVYVGKTTRRPADRWSSHVYSSKCLDNKTVLYRAMRKYGIETFKFEVIDNAESEEELSCKEIEWIARMETCNARRGYNCTKGGEGGKHGPQSRALLKGVRKVGPETRRKLSERIFTSEHRARLSEAARQRESLRTPAQRSMRARFAALTLAEHTRGVHRTEETRQKISRAHTGRKQTPERIEAHRQKLLGRKQGEQEVSRRSDANRTAWAEKSEAERLAHGAKTQHARGPWTAEQKLALSQKARGRVISDIARQKMSIAAKAKWALIKAGSIAAA